MLNRSELKPTKLLTLLFGLSENANRLLSRQKMGEAMGFVNEKVPLEDIEKYDLKEINRKFVVGETTYNWTIDRKRDIYLRRMKNNRQDPPEHYFSFHWKGHLLRINLRRCCASGQRGGPGKTVWGLSTNASSREIVLPSELEPFRDEITQDLKDALVAYKDAGVNSATTEHTASFLF